MLQKNRQAVVSILEALKPRIIGQNRPSWQCNCGAIHFGAATAVEVEPAGDNYPGQEVLWYLWSVNMSEHPDKPGYNHSCGIDEFVLPEELDVLFARYFENTEHEENPYNLKIDGADRVFKNLPAAVRIQDNDGQIRFCFSWGREQGVAQKIYQFFNKSNRRIPVESPTFSQVVQSIKTIKPDVYRGGPDPELPYESRWLLDYQQALDQAVAQANHIFFQNLSSTGESRGVVLTQADVVFMKHTVD